MTSPQEIDQLFKQYLTICNQAIAQHKDRFPYKQIWDAVEQMQSREAVDLTVYDDEPQSHYKLRLQDKQIKLIASDHLGAPVGWKLSTSYLRRVIAHPQDYIDHPAKLDWDWLKD
jgi:hypothetical protein